MDNGANNHMCYCKEKLVELDEKLWGCFTVVLVSSILLSKLLCSIFYGSLASLLSYFILMMYSGCFLIEEVFGPHYIYEKKMVKGNVHLETLKSANSRNMYHFKFSKNGGDKLVTNAYCVSKQMPTMYQNKKIIFWVWDNLLRRDLKFSWKIVAFGLKIKMLIWLLRCLWQEIKYSCWISTHLKQVVWRRMWN